MRGKSRRKGRRSFQGKKRKGRRFPPTIVTHTEKPVTPSRVAVPTASVPTLTPTPTAVQYPHIVSELRRVGILAGIMLAILVVLTLVLT